MHHARQCPLLVVVASIVAPLLWAQSSSPTQAASTAAPAPDLSIQRTLIGESNTARAAGDYATARAMIVEVVTDLLARPEAEQDPAWLALLNSAGRSAWEAHDARTANTAFQRVYELLSRTLPADHPRLQNARGDLAVTTKALGDLAGARALEEKVLEVRLRTLPDDHPDVQDARGYLAVTMRVLGDLAGARALEEKVLEVRSRTLPDDHPDVQNARHNLAATLEALGDLAGARALQEKVLEVQSRTLPADHPHLQNARGNLAGTIRLQGDLAGARALQEKVLEVRSRTLPDDHPDLQMARGNLAVTLFTLGDSGGARALFEKVLEVCSRTLPEDHPDLQWPRSSLAATLHTLGDIQGARALEEKVLEVRLRTLPDDHPALQQARGNLAATLHALGDFAGACALQQKVLEVRLRTLSDEHPDLQVARSNLASTIRDLGDLAGARVLCEKVLEVRLAALPDDHPDLQATRQQLALTILSQLACAGRSSEEGEEKTRTTEEGRERCADLIRGLCRAQMRAAREAIVGSPGREAEERCSSLANYLGTALSFASGYGVFEPLRELESPSFVVAETTRGAAITSAELARKAAHLPRYGALRDALREASDALAGLAQKGTTSEEFDRARVKRESLERELVALARELSGGNESGVGFDVESLAARLAVDQAAVGFRRLEKTRLDVVETLRSTGHAAIRPTSVETLYAFVVRGPRSSAKFDAATTLTLVDLGPIEPVEDAVRAWRDGLGVGSDSRGVPAGARAESTSSSLAQGRVLCERIFGQLLPALDGAQRIVVALDDVLHLVPLDALPFDESTLVGDHWRIETRATLTEFFQIPAPLAESGQMVAFGDVEYGIEATTDEIDAAIQLAAADVRPRTADVEPRAAKDAGILRGGAWSEGFSALPGTGIEVRGIAGCFRDQFGAEAAPELCLRAGATRERLLALATRARWLHIATHGWFAPESIKSWSEPEPLDAKSGGGSRLSGAEQVKGMSPMLLCGLALAGANRPVNTVGRTPGLITADELSTLDLTNCELAVLSACDTNVGERRAGQGVASLQKALQMAGARSVITSLWKVPDEATKELMLDFYRRLWVEKKPKWQALWEAKMKLREAKDERGALKYTTRDWAAWVLTGNPE